VNYDGPALVRVGERTYRVTLRLAGHTEPVDGRYHWGGRIAPDPELVGVVQSGQRVTTVQIGERSPVEARLGEPDPWGGLRIVGVGQPPYEQPQDVDADPYDDAPREAT